MKSMKLSAARGIVMPLAQREFRLLWIGQTISSLGNSFQLIAVTWLVLQEMHGSALDLAWALLALALPRIPVVLAGGVITDRLDPRTVMLWSDAIRVLTAGSIALLALSGALPLWLLCLLLAVHGLATGTFDPAANSIVLWLVAPEQLSSANSLMALISQLGTLLGAIPAGVIVATLGSGAAFAINACSFAVAVVAALLMKPLVRTQPEVRQSLVRDAYAGIRYLVGMPWLLAILLVDTCAALAGIGPIEVGLPLLVRDVLHSGPESYSLLQWSFGLGSVVGILLPGIYPFRHRRGLFYCIVQFLESFLFLGIASASLPLAMVCLAGVGLLNGALMVLFISLIQATVAREMMGRIMSFCMLTSIGFAPISLYVSGLVANAWGVKILLIASGFLTLGGAIVGFLVSSLRRLD